MNISAMSPSPTYSQAFELHSTWTKPMHARGRISKLPTYLDSNLGPSSCMKAAVLTTAPLGLFYNLSFVAVRKKEVFTDCIHST